jgi:hypothetical protein
VLYSQLNVTSAAPGSWYYVFPDAVTTAGVSATHSIGSTNLSIEASVRNNMPLTNANIVYPMCRPRRATPPAAPRTSTSRG